MTEPSGGAVERTWRPPLATRVSQVVVCATLAALPGGFVALALWISLVPNGPWIALALWLAAGGALARRVLGQHVTLTHDTLVIRNILTTRRVPLATITGVGFSRAGELRVTCQRGAFGDERYAVRSAMLGSSYWSGRRDEADDVAEAIAAAAGLPQLSPRRQIISPFQARLLLVPALLLFVVGLYFVPIASIRRNDPATSVTEVGVLCYMIGIVGTGFASRLIWDHRRQRRRQPVR